MMMIIMLGPLIRGGPIGCELFFTIFRGLVSANLRMWGCQISYIFFLPHFCKLLNWKKEKQKIEAHGIVTIWSRTLSGPHLAFLSWWG